MKPSTDGRKRGHVSPATPAKVTPRSCISCRQKHKKCDGQDPCGYCVRLGQPEQCLFSVPPRRGPKPMEDIYSYANRLLKEIEVQKQVAHFWKEQFMAAASGRSRTEMVEASSEQSDCSSPSSASYSTSSSLSQPQLQQRSTTHEMAPRFSTPTPSISFTDDILYDNFTLYETFETDGAPQSTTTPPLLTPQLAVAICRASIADVTPYLPIFDIDVPSPRLLLKLWNLSPFELHDLCESNPLEACLLFHQASLALWGASPLGQTFLIPILISKAESLLHLVLSNDQAALRNNPAGVRSVTSAIFLLACFFMYDKKYHDKVGLCVICFDIAARFPECIPVGLMARVYLGRIAISESIEDAKFWYNQTVSLSCSFVRQKIAAPKERESRISRVAVCDVQGGIGSVEPCLAYFLQAALSFGLSTIQRLMFEHTQLSPGGSWINKTSVPTADILEAESNLIILDSLIDIGLPLLSNFPTTRHIFEDAIFGMRYTGLEQRSIFNFLLGNIEEAVRHLEAFCLALQIVRPSLPLLIYASYSALETAIMANQPELVFLISEYLHMSNSSISGIQHFRERCSNYLSQIPAAKLEEVQRNNPFLLDFQQRMSQKTKTEQRIRELATSSRVLPIPYSRERITRELVRTEALIRTMSANLQTFHACIDLEAQQLANNSSALEGEASNQTENMHNYVYQV